jgi:hypothetical protein
MGKPVVGNRRPVIGKRAGQQFVSSWVPEPKLKTLKSLKTFKSLNDKSFGLHIAAN